MDKLIKTKIFAAYLPQFHETAENNEFWGKGFTDWVGVRNAKPQYEGHDQPRIPLNDNYYDLTNADTLRWQAELAGKYGISGFGIYHYWFKDSHKVLEKPAELILQNKDIDIEYFFIWHNSSWIRSWSNLLGNVWAPDYEKGKGEKIQRDESPYLLEYDLGGVREWREHFDYLSQFFLDDRYFKIDGKPVFIFFNDTPREKLKEMGRYWNSWARDIGLNGIFPIIQKAPYIDKHVFENQFIYQPLGFRAKKNAIIRRVRKYLHLPALTGRLEIFDYETMWKKVIKQAKHNAHRRMYFSGLVRYDDTPRRGHNAIIAKDVSPKLFEKYFREFYRLNCMWRREFLLLTAWNEWGEGAYLEPDETDGYAYLEALKRAFDAVKQA